MSKRACDACHAIKIKCEGGCPCRRCVRLEKTCLISAPIRQRDRIAELEAKLEEATRLLRLHRIQDPNLLSASTRILDAEVASSQKPGTYTNKRRRRSVSDNKELGIEDMVKRHLEIDHIIPQLLQRKLLFKYREETKSIFPFPVNGTYEHLRDESPLLLQTLIFAASQGALSSETQSRLTSVIMNLLASEIVPEAKKSTSSIQSLILASFYYRPARNEFKNNVAIDRFLNMATGIAEEIGISNTDYALSVASKIATVSDIGSSDAWRTWSLCYLLSASLSSCLRTSPSIQWDDDFELRLSSLEYGPDALSTDALLCQLIRAERLCQQITVEAGYTGLEITLEVSDYAKLRRMQNLVGERKAQTMSSMRCPILNMYEHFAIMLVHECILHTSTNIVSFAAPYIAERLSLTDFPTPHVTQEHVSSIHKLRESCHNVLDTFLCLETTHVTLSPMIMFTTKAFYSLWLLVKLYIATTSFGNTYGAFLNVRDLKLEYYIEKLAVLGDTVGVVDDTFMMAQMLRSARRLGEWVRNYDLLRVEESTAMTRYLEADHVGLEHVNNTYWDTSNFDIEDTAYNLETLFEI